MLNVIGVKDIRRYHVLRGGVEELVPARDLVPGDVVMLADGSMVPADLRLLDTASLRGTMAGGYGSCSCKLFRIYIPYKT